MFDLFDIDSVCENCPYDDSYQREWRKKALSDRIGKYADDWQPEYLWCDKVGGEHWQYGYCGDCFFNPPMEPKNEKSRKQRLNHHDNLIKHKKSGIQYAVKSEYLEYYYDDRNYFNIIKISDGGKIYSQRLYMSGLKKYCRKQTNRKIRHSSVGNHGEYRKMFDYWNTVF